MYIVGRVRYLGFGLVQDIYSVYGILMWEGIFSEEIRLFVECYEC